MLTQEFHDDEGFVVLSLHILNHILNANYKQEHKQSTTTEK